ncbi:MAG TPA: MerR family transcriptional regulator [Acidimicrobiales bacterium]|jgi:DNA-binding transcriptional MerR regulator|nr:MerR family transcriptional regulator [Acidimicrobiales bacterium]
MAEYRVEELAAEAGVTVELLRSYQSKGLLSAPRHEGRVALYDDTHLSRLREILDLKHQGYSLRMIAHLLGSGDATPAPRPSSAVLADTFADVDEEPLTLRQVAEQARVPPSMLRSLEASGVLVPRVADDDRQYSTSDVRAVRMLLALISGGLPIEEFMRAARTQIEANEQLAADARDLFLHYVRDPMLDAELDDDTEAEQLVSALALMLQATTTLISYNFQRRVLNGVAAELEKMGATTELEVLKREARRRRLEVLPA